VLFALWSPKGGSGTSVLAATCSLVVAREGGAVRLGDLDGDQPAIFGLPAEPPVGLVDWLNAGPEAPGVALLPRGGSERTLAPVPVAEAGAALAVALRDGAVATIVDCGRAADPAARAIVEVADVSVVVVRGCYLAVRRTLRAPALARTAGVVLVEEKDRSLSEKEVGDVLDLPVLARVPVKVPIFRAVDAGVLPVRLPESIARPASTLVHRVGVLSARRGAAA